MNSPLSHRLARMVAAARSRSQREDQSPQTCPHCRSTLYAVHGRRGPRWACECKAPRTPPQNPAPELQGHPPLHCPSFAGLAGLLVAAVIMALAAGPY